MLRDLKKRVMIKIHYGELNAERNYFDSYDLTG